MADVGSAFEKSPKISVVMPVFNGGKFLSEAVNSVLQQSYRDFELLIINDGSTDSSARILSDFASKDSRVTVFNRENHGLIATLNFAIARCNGEFVARMDADDVCEPERLARQVEFFSKNPNVAVLGTGYSYINQDGDTQGHRNIQTDDSNIRAAFFFGNPLAHPSIMFNLQQMPPGWQYDNAFEGAEDLALWLALSSQVKFANLAEPLLAYRLTGQSLSDKKSRLQRQSACNAIYLHSYLKKYKSGMRICDAIYNRRGGLADYPKFVWGCIQLNITNMFGGDTPALALLKRTLIAQVTFFKSPLRQQQTTTGI
ncbi:glycosyltransferase family 2 protein [Thalassotalea sp. PS06]|uniref:glycosyltransferase family 2 protein n=1 Tax=Thalassotalea sp. PS06 TaxID=2594005 RepID=UPI001165425C|nr:glycosyltransferase family 2 protein [Thalassotalea sp. PS06]QDP01789.1 glycosyltransferase family 2 protein [Thalassotalea sp. PS06]